MRDGKTVAIAIVASVLFVVLGAAFFATTDSHVDTEDASAAADAIRVDTASDRPWCPVVQGLETDAEEPLLDCPKGMVPIPRHLTVEEFIPDDDRPPLADPGPRGEIVRKSRVIQAFCIDRFEVTVGDYRRCVNAGKCSIPTKAANYWARGRERNPIDMVHIKQAKRYCRWHGNRLPSYRERERAGGDSLTPWPLDTRFVEGGVCMNRSQKQGACNVGTSPQDVSQYGVYDLGANVDEWTREVDIFGEDWSWKPGPWPVVYGPMLPAGFDMTRLFAGFRCAWSPDPEATEEYL